MCVLIYHTMHCDVVCGVSVRVHARVCCACFACNVQSLPWAPWHGISFHCTGYYSQACTCVLDEPGVCPGSCRYNIRIVTPWNPVKTSLPGHILRIPRYTAANNVEMRYEGEKCRIGRHGAPDPLRGYSEPVQTRSTESQVVVSHSESSVMGAITEE